MGTDIRVVVIDASPVFRSGIAAVLERAGGLRVVGGAVGAAAAAALIVTELPDLVLLGVDAVETTVDAQLDHVFTARADQQVLLLGRYSRAAGAHVLLRPGVRGQLPRQVTDEHLVSVVREIAQHSEWIFVSASRNALPALLTSDHTVLSPREQEVVQLMARSLSNREIARELRLSSGTVKRHVHNILTKLGAESRLDAIRRSVLRRPGPTPTQGNSSHH